MAADKAQPGKKAKPKAQPEIQKRALKSSKRKGGVPALKKKKRGKKKWIALGVVVIIGLVAAIFIMPRYGGIKYGICKTFVELHDPYPSFLEFIQSYSNGNVVDIDYNRIDSFGQRSLNNIRCTFNTDPQRSAELLEVDINGKANVYPQEDPAVVKSFSYGIPSLTKNKPDLLKPAGMPSDIKDYR